MIYFVVADPGFAKRMWIMASVEREAITGVRSSG